MTHQRPRDSNSNLKVICRFRPLIELEQSDPCDINSTFSFPSSETLTVISGETFTYDKVFPPSTCQLELFETIGKPIIEDVLTGYNGTVLAYGQTGSGKSFSMMGSDIFDDSLKGLIPRAVRLIFDSIEKASEEVEFTLKCSMLEIYKEKLKDLCGGTCELKIKESKTRGIYVEGISEFYVASEEEMISVLEMGEKNRAVASTKMNKVSSRSHQLFSLEVKQKLANDSEKRGTLNLVDLAGSEKINSTGVTGNKLEEAKKINLSLSALGNVIKALTSKAEHIPYRDSKLTRLLQESLGGNFKTSLLVCCSPHPSNLEDTLNTLKFAQRAKTIKNKVHINIKKSVEEYLKIIDDLRVQLHKSSEEIEYLKQKLMNPQNFCRSLSLKDVPIDSLHLRETLSFDLPEETFQSTESETVLSLKSEIEALQEQVKEMTESLAKETNKRLLADQKHLEALENFNKLRIQTIDYESKREYEEAERLTLKYEIEALRNHIKNMNLKYSEVVNNVKLGEKIVKWEFFEFDEENLNFESFSEDSESYLVHETAENLVDISIDPSDLLSKDIYSQLLSLNLERSSSMNHDLVIFQLKKQIINSGLVNCEIFRNYHDLKLRENLLNEKLKLKTKLVKSQKETIKLYEEILTKLHSFHIKTMNLIESKDLDSLTCKESKGGKIAKPIKINVEPQARRENRLNTFNPTQQVTGLRPRSININEISSLRQKNVESEYEILLLYNQKMKKELEILNSEKNTLKKLHQDFQSEFLSNYSKDKERWKGYLEGFKKICEGELLRRQMEINVLNNQIATWIHRYLGSIKSLSSITKFPTHKRSNTFDISDSPLHTDSRQVKLVSLPSKRGDSTPPQAE